MASRRTSCSESRHPFVTELDIELKPDPMRTVIRPFLPSDPDGFSDPEHPRGERIIARVLALDNDALHAELKRARLSLDKRHRNVGGILRRRFADVSKLIADPEALNADQRVLIGAYFSAEYSFESAALFNPSIVPFGEVGDDGGTPFLISLRGIGEGHLSSVTFRTGNWAADGSVTVNTASQTAVPPIIEKPRGWHDGDTIQLNCTGSREPSETVLFPVVASQSRGIEDLRLTPFVGRDGRPTYAGTFTALGDDGVRQELVQTDDFKTFKMHPINGDLAGAKGMALFPRRIGDRYLALGRQDNENLWLFESDDIFTWQNGRKLLEPVYPWEYIQVGNCGSPIEIDEGWLVLTHGVGVVRNYCMGAALLDRDDPFKVLGRMSTPLLEPCPADRDGYVPNVVYSCGALLRDRTLLLPYGIADDYTAFATIDLDGLVAAMTKD